MRNFLTLTLIGFASQKALIPENQYDVCLTKLDRGHTNCQNPQNQIRFYFDEQLENCFAYLYEGCDGGRNTFYTEHQCLLTCIPADKHTCGGNMIPTGSCHNMDLTCPFGSTCLRGAHGAGLCCDDVNEDEWLKELTPLCRIGKVLTRHMWYGERVWIGRNCSHRQVSIDID
ncbi:Kunitz/Bovine pancreatic trypsin inhibitor domain protein [Dictyocaulus viviparus]|uniref:Kunitz/Bovine pancreatic trypsin inhibitor domain protein n=1 Tax=Dictyocaulus viviparus TaxID=29172 RepID=A0A0D8Y915_DICVI|nr:Kunitz/Bovine pancreatic trypsin inhibitor domain protein [Dictyocaulus viviparus]